MQQVMPEVVEEGEYLSVAYGNLVGVLIEAVKELKEIDYVVDKDECNRPETTLEGLAALKPVFDPENGLILYKLPHQDHYF